MKAATVDSSLLKRAARLSRRLTWVTVGAALIVSFALVYGVVGDTESGGIWYGKLVGLTGGMTFIAAFMTSLFVGSFVGRKYLVGRLESWVARACRKHRLEPDSLDYIVAMYAKPHVRTKGDD
jgi:hypothetical protein